MLLAAPADGPGRLTRARGVRLRLVNTPMGVQHHPYITFSRGAFGNSSVVLHGLKNAEHLGWAYAARRGSGAFEPVPRVCDSCRRMGWSMWPGSAVNDWECCGRRVEPELVNQSCARRPCG